MIVIKGKFLTVLSILITVTSTLAFAQLNPEDQAKIDELFVLSDNDEYPGAAIGVIRNGELIYAKGYGSGNLDYQIPLTPDSRFYIASIAKQFTAACIALLSLEGKLNLDDDIRMYFPEIPDYG